MRDAALTVLSQHFYYGSLSYVYNAIGLSQGEVFEAGPTCESRFKTLQHTAWWGYLLTIEYQEIQRLRLAKAR